MNSMKKRILSFSFLAVLAIMLQAFRWNSMTAQDQAALARPMAESLKQLMLEGKTGFAARRGKPISKGKDGALRYKTASVDGLHADDQYLAVKNGAEVFVAELNGRDVGILFYNATKLFTNEGDRQGGDVFTKTLILSEGAAEPNCGDSWCQYALFREHPESAPLAWYKENVHTNKITLLIGPVAAYQNEPYLSTSAKKEARIAKNLASMEHCG